MANTHTTLTELFTDIADAIKEKNGKIEPIVADTFPTEIENLKTGFDYINSDVTEIPDYAFYGCEDLKSFDCYNVTSIGANAFENCTGLKSAVLYEGVTNVGESVFKGCSEDLVIYCEATEKLEGWDEDWNPDGCNVVWGFAPVETWDISATENDNVIAKLYNDINNEGYYSLFISGNGNMMGYRNNSSVSWYNYRQNIDFVNVGDSVTNIGSYAFHSCTSLTSITIPDSVTNIGVNAFRNCTSLTSINIPNSVTNIGDSTFRNCTSLTSINIPNSVTNIGDSAFHNCTSLTSINIPNSVTSIGSYAFNGCTSLTSINIPNSVTSIGGYAFNGTVYYNESSNWKNEILYIDNALIRAKTSISGDYIIKESVTSIGDSAFEDCTSLTSITIPDSVTSIGEKVFMDCTSLTSIIIPNSVTNINYGAFMDCTSLTSITIPDSVTSIGINVFYNCKSLTSIIIPDSVTSISNGAFNNCGNLIYNEYDNAYYLGNDNNPYIVLVEAKNKDITYCDIHNDTKIICDVAFCDCVSLTSIAIPYNVASIKSDTFFGCISLMSVTIPNSIISIDWQAFYKCNKLTLINYTGTISQWKAIIFDTDWNYNTGNYTIHCTDGDISKNGTITYH